MNDRDRDRDRLMGAALPPVYPPCTLSNSILESDLELAAQYNIVNHIKVFETPKGFYVTAKFADRKGHFLKQIKPMGVPEAYYVLAQLLGEPGKEWYLTTRRNRDRPRMFKDLKRLNDLLLEKDPLDGFTLLRNQGLPGEARPMAVVGDMPANAKLAKS
ncbi:hypothetical protein LCZ91_22680 [Xanthomonas citri pv. mangiferaeindicae]|uniref:Uncharacterized protein n=1 Tax=Xanthomonas cissicola TaxID=86186 RepID=A0ABX3M296_9XANT|nr:MULTISPECIES: hypothetical protein [Xanthomonas]KAB0527755.1 hypothetical protein F7R02_22840 [Xanthomonas cissicola]OOW71591.1 hypothetical protein Xant_19155 [Xanthomonas cissicola]UDB88454.1 hypothetical protein LCZ91_22680 [Xanthomonas citri pv. mangiferaeindicae]